MAADFDLACRTAHVFRALTLALSFRSAAECCRGRFLRVLESGDQTARCPLPCGSTRGPAFFCASVLANLDLGRHGMT